MIIGVLLRRQFSHTLDVRVRSLMPRAGRNGGIDTLDRAAGGAALLGVWHLAVAVASPARLHAPILDLVTHLIEMRLQSLSVGLVLHHDLIAQSMAGRDLGWSLIRAA